MKKIIAVLFLAAVLAVFSAGCVAPDNQNTSVGLDPTTAILGDWKSVNTYTASTGSAYLVYSFNNDNTGTVGQEINGVMAKTINIYWGYDTNQTKYAIGYPASQSVEMMTMTADGKTIVNADGDKFNKI